MAVKRQVVDGASNLKGEKDHGRKLDRVRKGYSIDNDFSVLYCFHLVRIVAAVCLVTRRDNCLELADRSAPSHVTRHVSRDTPLCHTVPRPAGCLQNYELFMYTLNV